jgi:hypothetical protein
VGVNLGGDRFLFLLKIFCFHANYSDFSTFFAKKSGNVRGRDKDIALSPTRLESVCVWGGGGGGGKCPLCPIPPASTPCDYD